MPTPWSQCLDCAALSDVGMRRVNNEDSFAVALASSQEDWNKKGHLFLVADGMGFHAAGELASKLAADNVPLSYQKYAQLPPTEALLKAVQDANELIRRRGEASDEFRGMGTTCTTMVLIPAGVLVAHIGDSRCYRLRGAVFEQLTFDHSMVWEMWAAGSMTPEQVQQFVPKNIITRAMGRDWNVQVDLEGPLPVQIGDTYLLCTDGLSGQLSDKEMGALLACLPPQKAARLLVDLGNLRGGPDNITLIVARVLGPQVPCGAAADSPPPLVERAAARPIHPLAWTGLGLFASLTLAMSLAEYWAAAVVGLVGTAIAALVVIWQRNRAAQKPTAAAPSGPLGRGPYVRCDAAADRELVERLAATVQELRDAAAQGEWVVDWANFNNFQGRATAALGRGEMVPAVCEYSEAICFMMDQLRQQNNRKPGQDHVIG